MSSEDCLSGMAGHLIRRLNQHSTALFQERMKQMGFDLTSVQYAALRTLQDRPGIDQAGLANTIAYDRATIGGVIKRLEAKGFIERKVNADDRRARVLSVSEAGRRTLAEVTPVVMALQPEILGKLSGEERAQFLRLAEKAVGGEAEAGA